MLCSLPVESDTRFLTDRKQIKIEFTGKPDETRDIGKDDSEQRSSFTRSFREEPEFAVEQLTEDVLFRHTDAQSAAGILLPYLVKASYAQRNLVYNALMTWAQPEDLLFAALLLYETDHDLRVLQLAGQLLEHYGADAASVLTRLCASGRSECKHFVGTVFKFAWPSQEQKQRALVTLARHPDRQTRQQLLDEVDRGSDEDAALVCRLLVSDLDLGIRRAVEERLAGLEQ
jgi:hypothetical protein